MAPGLIRIEFIDSRHQRISCHLQRGGSPNAGVEIGRGREAGLPIDDETVSRRQAIVRVDPEGRIFIRDLESRSESRVNWMILDSNEEVRLRHGDRLGFGSAEVTVALPDGDGPEDPVVASVPDQSPPGPDEFQTRGSLLLRLNANGTVERELGWQEFYDRYVPLIMGFCRRAGTREEESEDVAHEVMANFFRASTRFEYDPNAGRFRGYLKAATLNTLRARWRKRRDMIDADAGSELPIEDTLDVDEIWDREWIRSIITRALTTVRSNGSQSGRSWEAFELYGRRGVPIEEVGLRLDMSPEAIRQAKSRISRQVRVEIERIRAEEG